MPGSSTAGRYRWRTRARRRLPWFVIDLGLAAKGHRDCGNHEWYNADGLMDRCYHCEVGVRAHESSSREA